jgi:hypothetical protein
MANIPIPQQGQPIDYQYIYQIVNNLNELSTKVTSKFSESVFDNTKSTVNVKESHRMNDFSVVAAYIDVANGTNVNAGSELPFYYTFSDINFKYPPIVTATPVMNKSSEAGKDASVVISNITKGRIDGWIAFNASKAGKVYIGVNIIAFGIPEMPA